MPEVEQYQPRHHVRIVSAAALFDGHDAAINIMRRILQATGAEVIHLGHNRSADEIATAAIQEDAQGIALTSYQGGHMELFTYLPAAARRARRRACEDLRRRRRRDRTRGDRGVAAPRHRPHFQPR